MKSFIREIAITGVLALVIFFVIKATIGSFIVVGISMDPSFLNGQRLLVNKVVYHLHEPERGDVIVFQPNENPNEDYIKRIIALPDDTVEINQGKVYVNGSELDEPYIKSSPRYTVKPKVITENSYFVLGDNRNNSNDSHNGWVVPHQNIVGKAWLSMWPPAKWGLVPSYTLQAQLAPDNCLVSTSLIYNKSSS